jgi:hypothetical protein
MDIVFGVVEKKYVCVCGGLVQENFRKKKEKKFHIKVSQIHLNT